MAVGSAVDELRVLRNPVRGRHPNAAREGWIVAGIFAVLSIVLLLVFRRQLRRTREPEREFPLGLSGDAHRLLLWSAFAAGAMFGIALVPVMSV